MALGCENVKAMAAARLMEYCSRGALGLKVRNGNRGKGSLLQGAFLAKIFSMRDLA